MRSDSFWAKVVQASRPGRPLFRITASPWWTEVLVAAGAQRARADDSMTTEFRDDDRVEIPRQPSDEPEPQELKEPGPPQLSDILVIRPLRYSDARAFANMLRDGMQFVLDLQGMRNRDAVRMVDFSAGLIYGMQGSIEKIRDKVFLLTPPTAARSLKDFTYLERASRRWRKDAGGQLSFWQEVNEPPTPE